MAMHEITMPKLSDSMETGTIVSWLVAGGERIVRGAELAEIETDKATVTLESEADGVVEIVVPAGSTVAVGELIARVGLSARTAETPAQAREVVPQVSLPTARATNDGSPRPLVIGATPLARRLAKVSGVELAQLVGTGPRGRITRYDVALAAGIEASPPPRPAAAAPVAGANGSSAATDAPALSGGPDRHLTAGDEDSTQELTGTQQLIARRMAHAKATIPHFQVQAEVVMDEAIALRGRLRELAAPDTPMPSVNDLIVKACAVALRRHPRVNGSYEEGAFKLHARVNVAVAVAAPDTLVVPTVFDADTKSLGAIAAESRRLAERVRSAEITPAELSGATFTVSNLGMYGMSAITPVINPPQAAILGVGALRQILVRVDGEIVDRTVMTLTLSCDHRILYGADAAAFLSEIRDLLQEPLRMLAA
jgi:pyruvate dehydrogenase E2 component (dihydrolipoamide acetyltransferase)